MENQQPNICNENANVPYIPTKLAMAFVVPQTGGDTYEPMEALSKGTIYPALYMPYTARRDAI